MRNFVIVSYYTIGKGYEAEAQRLKDSIRKLGLIGYVVPTRDLGSWQLNTKIKPFALLSALNMLPGTPVVWVDCDAEFTEYPALFNYITGDIAVYLRRGSELLSGTIFLQNNDRVRTLLWEWIHENEANPELFDQVNLQTVLNKRIQAKQITLQELPASYCKIFDAEDQGPDGVIVHHQASRKLRWK